MSAEGRFETAKESVKESVKDAARGSVGGNGLEEADEFTNASESAITNRFAINKCGTSNDSAIARLSASCWSKGSSLNSEFESLLAPIIEEDNLVMGPPNDVNELNSSFVPLSDGNGSLMQVLVDRNNDAHFDAVYDVHRNIKGRIDRVTIDHTGDGEADLVMTPIYSLDGTVSRIDVDRNRDGQADGTYRYRRNFARSSAEDVLADTDGDGETDALYSFKHGGKMGLTTLRADRDMDDKFEQVHNLLPDRFGEYVIATEFNLKQLRQMLIEARGRELRGRSASGLNGPKGGREAGAMPAE